MLFVLGDLVICLHGYTWATLGQGLSLIGKVLFSYSIHVIFELFEAFDLRATFVISIINIFWLHWIINRLVVMHPYAPGFNGSDKDNCNTRRKISKCWGLVRLISKVWRYMKIWVMTKKWLLYIRLLSRGAPIKRTNTNDAIQGWF